MNLKILYSMIRKEKWGNFSIFGIIKYSLRCHVRQCQEQGGNFMRMSNSTLSTDGAYNTAVQF